MALRLNWRVYDVMPCAFFNDSFNDIHELKCGQAEEKLEAGRDEKLIFNFIWPYGQNGKYGIKSLLQGLFARLSMHDHWECLY